MTRILNLIEELLRNHFDKLFLAFILILLIGVGAVATLEDTKEWAMGQANTVIGGILMLATKQAVDRISAKKEPPPTEEKTP